MDHDHKHDESVCDKFRIPWGMSSIIEPLTEDNIEALKAKLTKLGKEGNVISSTFTDPEVAWIKENVADIHMKRVTDDTDDNTVWVVIGPDRETVMKYYSRI